MSPALDELLALFESDLATAMYDEVVTEREHALQAAEQAEAAGASDTAVAAALLHDVGRLLIDADLAAADRAHDQVGERYLRQWFGPEVTAPVGLHVAAKRYLCATEPDYLAVLSAVSVRSLEVQGGPMTPAEVGAFRAGEGWQEAVQLRRWDDDAKQEDRPTKAVADYHPLLLRLVAGWKTAHPPHESSCGGCNRGRSVAVGAVPDVVDRVIDLVLHGVDGILELPAGLVGLAFGLQVVVVGQRTGRFLRPALGLIHLACHVDLLVGGEQVTYPEGRRTRR